MMENNPKYKAEMDWSDLLKKPAKLFGYSYFYFVIILGALGYLYISNLTNIGKNSIAPAVLSDSTAFIQDIPMQSGRVIPPADVMKVGISSPELIAKGSELFKANCSSCHGDNGQGDGPTAPTLNPKPRNFHLLDGWKNGSKVSQIYKTLQEGIAGSGMASYNYLSPEDRFGLIHYVRSFAAGQPVDSPEYLKQLDVTYQLSKGMNVAGQIPVKKAMQIIVNETKINEVKISDELKLALAEESQGADVFWRVVKNASKVFTGFSNSRNYPIGIDQFIKTVTADPIQFGFKANVVQLSSEEWQQMHKYIVTVVAQKEK
jgi:mono/diheme cytochrome c family protein